jgi:hypothetical protein
MDAVVEETHTDEEIDRIAEEIANELSSLDEKKSAKNEQDDEEEMDQADSDEEDGEEEEVEENLANLGDKKAKPFKKKGAKTEEAESDEEEDEDEDVAEETVDEEAVEEVSEGAMQKQEMIRNLFSQMQKTRRGKISDSYEKMMGLLMQEEEEDDEADAEDEMEESRKAVTKEDIDISDDLSAIFGSSPDALSEDFMAQAKTIFEAAVVSKINTELDLLEANYASKLEEAEEKILDEMTEKVDTYLSYVVEEWVKDNELAIDTGLKSEITEDFIGGLKQLFEEHYIEIPDDKVDVVESLAGQVDTLEGQLNETINQNVELSAQVNSFKKDEIIADLADDLTDVEIEKMKGLAENIDFSDDDQFREALVTIKEGYFSRKTSSKPTVDPTENELTETALHSVSPQMSSYLKVIGRNVKNY